MFENHVSDKELIPKIYTELTCLNSNNNKLPTEKGEGDLNKQFSKEDIQVDNRCVKQCSPPLIIPKM